MCAAMAMIVAPTSLSAQFNLKKRRAPGIKAAKAFTLTDAQMADYVKESVDWMDRNNKVDAEDGEYTKRLRRLTEGITDADGIPLNFKVYLVIDVNAFACPRRQRARILLAYGHHGRRRTSSVLSDMK